MEHTEHLDKIKRFLHSQERLMLVIGEAGCGKTSLLDDIVSKLKVSRHIIRLTGNPNLQPQQLIEILSKNWGGITQHNKARLETQLIDVLNSLNEHDHHCLLVIHDAHTLPFTVLAALSFLNHVQ